MFTILNHSLINFSILAISHVLGKKISNGAVGQQKGRLLLAIFLFYPKIKAFAAHFKA